MKILKQIDIKVLIQRVEFWIILFFLIRLIGITNPPLEASHNWRQITGLMVSRNFVEQNSNILYPRINDNYGTEGIVGMEFPLMNYLYFLIAKIFGYTHWYGRLINLLISSIGIFYFHKIIERYFNSKIALLSAICLLASVWFAFSRKMMPDTFCVSLILIAMYFGLKYLDIGKAKNLILYILFSTLAILSKIPAIIYLAIFVVPFLGSKINLKNKIILAFSTFIPLIFTTIWYFIWNPYLSQKYGIWYNSGKNILIGFKDIVANIDIVLKIFYFHSFYSYIFLSIFLIGLFFIFKNKEKKLIYIFISFTLVFIMYMFKSGSFFYQNTYYIIPFVPLMALISGYVLSLINKKLILILLILFAVSESIINQQQDFFVKKSELYKLQLEQIADSISQPNDLVAINSEGNPQQLYLTHRKGWIYANEQLSNSVFIQNISNRKCKFLFVNKTKLNTRINYQIVFENNFYIVYKLN